MPASATVVSDLARHHETIPRHSQFGPHRNKAPRYRPAHRGPARRHRRYFNDPENRAGTVGTAPAERSLLAALLAGERGWHRGNRGPAHAAATRPGVSDSAPHHFQHHHGAALQQVVCALSPRIGGGPGGPGDLPVCHHAARAGPLAGPGGAGGAALRRAVSLGVHPPHHRSGAASAGRGLGAAAAGCPGHEGHGIHEPAPRHQAQCRSGGPSRRAQRAQSEPPLPGGTPPAPDAGPAGLPAG